MSNDQTNSETSTPRKPRKGSKAAIDAEMAANAKAHVDPAKGAEWEAAQQEAADAAAEAVAAARQEAMPPRRFESPLPCKLTDKELLAVGDRIEAAMDLAETIEEQRKLDNDGAKARVKLAMEEVRTLRKIRSSGVEDRNVEQTETFDLRRCTAQTFRTDTGELVSERALRSSELQPDLPMTNGQNGHAQMHLGDVEPTDINDAESLLRDAAKGETDPADASLQNDGSSEDLGDEDNEDSDDSDDSDDEEGDL